jgi:hypothetical protein
MMPLKYIAKHVQEMRTVDIEEIGGLLEYHKKHITVGNAFGSDCGDRWDCELMDYNDPDNVIRSSAPSLRTAVLDALDEAIETKEKKK